MDMKYIRDLHKADDRVQSVSPQIHKSNRPFVGVVVICDEHKYCVPLDSAKEKHKTQKNDVDFTRIFDGEKLISVLNFNNMIPVDDSYITKIDLKPSPKDNPAQASYKKLCIKEIEWCRKNQEAIVKKANKLYYLVQKPNCSSMLKKRCNDFKKLEKVLEKLLQKKIAHFPTVFYSSLPALNRHFSQICRLNSITFLIAHKKIDTCRL